MERGGDKLAGGDGGVIVTGGDLKAKAGSEAQKFRADLLQGDVGRSPSP